MKKLLFIFVSIVVLSGCATKKQITYFNDFDRSDTTEGVQVILPKQTIQPHDILKIDVYASSAEATAPYSKLGSSNFVQNNIQMEQLKGYVVSDDYNINFPILGTINLKGKDLNDVENQIINRLVSENHLLDPIVSVKLINARFTVLGEVRSPGTFPYVGQRISLLQALGYAGDLTINGERSEILLIREADNVRKIHEIDLRSINSMRNPKYFIQSNDVIVVHPNFRKVKSAGFIGNPSSIASISSLLLSITLLLINN